MDKFDNFLFENNFIVRYGKCSGMGYGIPYWADIDELWMKNEYSKSSLTGYGSSKEKALESLKEIMSGKVVIFNDKKIIQCPVF